MRYTANHPKQEFSRALHLSTKQRNKLDNAIQKVLDETVADRTTGTFSMDEISGAIAPYIVTAEEAYYTAMTLCAFVQNAASLYQAAK